MESDDLRLLILRSINDRMTTNRYNKNYVAEISRYIRMFYSWAAKRGLGDITKIGKKDLLSYRNHVGHLQSRNPGGGALSLSTMCTMLTAVKHVYKMLYLNGYIQDNPLHSVDYRITSGKQNRRRPLTKKEMAFFLDSIDTATPMGLRDRTIFELIYSSGLRVSEAAGLRIGDIDFENREAIVRGKFDRDRIVPLTQGAACFLKKYLGKRLNQVDDNVFLGLRAKGFHRPMRGSHISRIFREYLRKFNMDCPEISTHSVRHSTATHLLDNGASVRHVQELLGHKNIETTVRYTHVQTEGLFRVFRRHHHRERELFDMVDENYLERLNRMIENPD